MLKKITLAIAILGITNVSGHDINILPSAHNVNKIPTTVAIDVTATHGVYRLDFGVAADLIKVYGSDGKSIRRFGTIIKGKKRTSFELDIPESGTYKITYQKDSPRYMATYEIGKRNTKKRKFGKLSDIKSQIPEDAKNLNIKKLIRSAVTYINAKAPTNEVLKHLGKGFELIPVTHPADYVTGEDIAMQVLLDGKPIKGAEVNIYPEHDRYTATGKKSPIKLETDSEGKISINFKEGGRFATRVLYSRKSSEPGVDTDSFYIFYTFEVNYE